MLGDAPAALFRSAGREPASDGKRGEKRQRKMSDTSGVSFYHRQRARPPTPPSATCFTASACCCNTCLILGKNQDGQGKQTRTQEWAPIATATSVSHPPPLPTIIRRPKTQKNSGSSQPDLRDDLPLACAFV
jgi:hypothetical protein